MTPNLHTATSLAVSSDDWLATTSPRQRFRIELDFFIQSIPNDSVSSEASQEFSLKNPSIERSGCRGEHNGRFFSSVRRLSNLELNSFEFVTAKQQKNDAVEEEEEAEEESTAASASAAGADGLI